MIQIGVVIVSYNVAELIEPCLRSVQTAFVAGGLSGRIVVVDNASTDDSVARMRHEFPDVTVLASERNLGFAGGNNLGLRELGFGQPDADLPQAVLLLNPDTVIEPEALATLWKAIQTRPESIVIGPRLRYGDGSLQSSRRRFPTLGTLFWEATLLEQWWPTNPWVRRYHLADQPADRPQQVDWLVGAALLVRSAAIVAGGLLDDGFFMYSEELEWQERLHQITGGTIWYEPDAVIVHYEGKSSEQNLARRQINFSNGRLRYTSLRFGHLVALVLRCFLALTFVVQSATEAAKWVLGHKRPLRATRLAQYRQVLVALIRG